MEQPRAINNPKSLPFTASIKKKKKVGLKKAILRRTFHVFGALCDITKGILSEQCV